jgi:hypothetical protein
MNDCARTPVVLDSRGRANGGAGRNTNLVSVDGRIGGALSFNGTDDYIIIPRETRFDPGLGDFSISFWINDGFDADKFFLIIEDPDNIHGGMGSYAYGCAYSFSNSQLVFFINLGAQGQHIAYAIVPQNTTGWHHIVGVVARDSSIKVYFDNVLGIYADSIPQDPGWDLTGQDLLLGKSGGQYYSFSLDNILFFNKALSGDEIASLWNDSNGTEVLSDTDAGMPARLETWAVGVLSAIEDDGAAVFRNVQPWRHQIGLGNSGVESFERFAPFAFVKAEFARADREGGYDLNMRIRLTVAIGQTGKSGGSARIGDGTRKGVSQLSDIVRSAIEASHPGDGFSCDNFYFADWTESVDTPDKYAAELAFEANWLT